MLIKPNHFGYNLETAFSNHFQKKTIIPDLEKKVLAEFEGVLKQFEVNNIAYKVFDNENASLPDAVFSNNWIANVPSGKVILYPMCTENRRGEARQDVINWVMQVTNSDELIDLRNEIGQGRFLEGTGSIIFDHFLKKAYACESIRTNIALLEAHCSELGYTPHSFESLDLMGAQIYHTNVMLSIAEKYCLVNLESVQNQLEQQFLKIALENSGKEIIAINYPQTNAFAGNVLEVLDESKQSCLVMSETAYQSLNKVQIACIEQYSKIVQVNVRVIEEIGGGGIRCMMTGLFT